MPKVSVLVPIFNVEQYLHQCLKSLITQTLKDIEIICINDGSTDRSLEIVKQYAARDNRIVIIDKANSGYGDSMNQGLKIATGEYIGIVESDDWADSQMFEELYGFARANNNPDVVKSDYYNYYTTPQKRLLSGTPGYIVPPHLDQRTICPIDEPAVFLQKPAIWSGIYRRDFLNANGITFLPSPGASYQDTGFAFKVWSCAKRATFTTNAYLHYRQDNEASSVASPGKVFSVSDEYAEIYSFLNSHDLYELINPIFQVARWGGYNWNIDRLTPPLAADFIDFATKQFNEEMNAELMDLSMFDVNQMRQINELILHPEQLKKRITAYDEALVTVVVPVHNTAAYLKECLDSILNQTLQKTEIILVDDGSIDQSIDILEEYYRKDPRIQLVSQENRGAGASRNAGIELAHADWITFIDSDDYYELNSIELLYDGVVKNTCDLAIGSIRPIFEPSTRSAIQRRVDEQYYRLDISGTYQMNPSVLKQVDMSPCNKIFKRQLLIDKNLRFPDGLHFEDAYFANAYCWLVKNVIFLPRDVFVYNYRRRPGSVMDGAFTKGRIAVEHMEIGFRLLDPLERFKVQKEYGQYYMDILLSYIGFTMRFSPGFALPDQWRKLAHWVSYHYATLKKLDPKKTEEIIRWIPEAYRHDFVGSDIQSLPVRAYRKARRIARKGFQAVFPAYRAAEKTRRQIVALEAQVTAISDSIDRLANKLGTYTQKEASDD